MRIVISGPPSAGKSTQGLALALHLGVPHFSSGEIIRSGARTGDPVAARLASIVADGSLAPSDAIVAMVLDRLSREDCGRGFVLDGFPRRLPEAKALVDAYGPDGIDAFVVLDAGVDTLMARVRQRARQASLVRVDDDPRVFPGRVATYLSETQPVRDYMASRGVHVYGVDANPEVDEVQADLRRTLRTEEMLAPSEEFEDAPFMI